jgi:hypothetical protein
MTEVLPYPHQLRISFFCLYPVLSCGSGNDQDGKKILAKFNGDMTGEQCYSPHPWLNQPRTGIQQLGKEKDMGAGKAECVVAETPERIWKGLHDCEGTERISSCRN